MKIEDTIAYLEDTLKETDEIMADCSKVLQAELLEQAGHYKAATSALEKQIPKDVEKENGFYFCPVCSRGGNLWDRQIHCQYCGQALK